MNLLLLLVYLMTRGLVFKASPQVCLNPCKVTVQYRAPENTRYVEIWVINQDGLVIDVSGETANDYTRQRGYLLSGGDYVFLMLADDRQVAKQLVEVVDPQ